MYYFGPLKQSGHYLFHEDGEQVSLHEMSLEPPHPWHEREDGALQPGRVFWRGRWVQRGPMVEGEALIHHFGGWTALSFWDSTIDTRPGSSSTYIAEGTFTFEQMVEMARMRFAERWNRMKFEVRLAQR